MDHQTLVTHQYPVVALQNLETQPTSWRFLYRSMASSIGGGREGLKSGGALDLFRRTIPTTSYLRHVKLAASYRGSTNFRTTTSNKGNMGEGAFFF